MFSQASSPQEPDIVSSGSAIEDSQPAIEMLRRLQDGTNAEVTGNIAGQILSYLNNGIDSFSATDIARDLGVSRKSVNNFMKSFVEKNYAMRVILWKSALAIHNEPLVSIALFFTEE